MLTRAPMFVLVCLALPGCSQKPVTTVKSLGGTYYSELTKIHEKWPPLMEPHSDYRERYIHVDSGQTNEITQYLGGFADSVDRNFSYRIYGSNFVYVERVDGSWSKFRLRDYSAKNGNITVDENFGNYWKVTADEQGITCHRYQDGHEKEDPHPIVYTGKYLSGL
jgi:hypothetical protein